MYAKSLDVAARVVAISVSLLSIFLSNVTAQVCWLQQIYGANSDNGQLVQYNANETYCVQLCTSLGGSCQAVDYDVMQRNCFTHPNTNDLYPSSCCVRYHYTCGYTRACTSDSFVTVASMTSVNRDRVGIVQPAVRNESQCQSFCVTYGVSCTRAITYRLNATHLACLLYTTLNDSFTTSNNSNEKVHMRKFCRPIPANVSLSSSTTTTRSTTTTTTTTRRPSTTTTRSSTTTPTTTTTTTMRPSSSTSSTTTATTTRPTSTTTTSSSSSRTSPTTTTTTVSTTTTTNRQITPPVTTTTSPSTPSSSGKPRTPLPSATIPSSSTHNPAVFVSVSSIWPLCGPLAGGTRMTISGHLINTSTVRAVLIGSYRLIPDGSNSSTSIISADSIAIVTPAVNETLQRHLPIAVELTDGFILTTNFSFEYRDNPTFVGIQPREHLLVGGTLVTVKGISLGSVAAPRIIVTVVVTWFINVTDTQMSSNTSSAPCWFPADADAGGYEMLCRMPPVELPPDFDPQQNTSIRNISETSGVAVYYGPNGRDRADVYVGLHLDGLTTYINISAVKPDIKMMFYGPPTILCDDSEMDFNPRENHIIAIKGSNLARGSRLVDFNITVGDGVCDGVDLTDDKITCGPPSKKPKSNRASSLCDSGSLSIDLLIGNAAYHCSCLRYEDSTDDFPLILGLAVGLGGLLFLILFIVCVCVIVRRRRKQTVGAGTSTINAWGTLKKTTGEPAAHLSQENDYANLTSLADADQPLKPAMQLPPAPILLPHVPDHQRAYVNKEITEVTTTSTSTDAEQPLKPAKKLPPVPPVKLGYASDVQAASEATAEMSSPSATVYTNFVNNNFSMETLRPSANSGHPIKVNKKLPPTPTQQTTDVDDSVETSVGDGLYVNQSEFSDTVYANSVQTETNVPEEYEKLGHKWRHKPNVYQQLPVNRQLY